MVHNNKTFDRKEESKEGMEEPKHKSCRTHKKGINPTINNYIKYKWIKPLTHKVKLGGYSKTKLQLIIIQCQVWEISSTAAHSEQAAPWDLKLQYQ